MEEKVKLLNKIWIDSYINNKYGARIFSFSYFREKMKENNITEDELSVLLFEIKPMLEETNMRIKEFVQWIFNPTEEQINAENYFDNAIQSDLDLLQKEYE